MTPIMRAEEWNAARRMADAELMPQYAIRDLVDISNIVDGSGRTMRAEGAVRLLRAAGVPNPTALKVRWVVFEHRSGYE